MERPATYSITWSMRLPHPLRNMARRWRGMVGMMVGVGIALGVVATLVVMSKASIDIYTADFLRSGTDLYVVTQGGTLVPALPGESPGTIKHARNVLTQIRGIPGVSTAIGVMSWSMEREHEGRRRRDEPAELIATLGVDGDPTLVPGMLVLREGRWLRRSNEAVVGSKLSREKSLGIGSILRVNGRDFVVVGVGKLRGFGFGTDSLAYLDYRAFRDRAEIGDVVSTIAVDTHDPGTVRQRVVGLGSLTAFDPPALVKKAEEVQASGTALYWIFDLLSMAVGGLFVSNMLSRSVAERRLEFATLRAIGLPSRTILLTVITEAIAICAVAGIIGTLMSLVLGFWINVYVAEPLGIEPLFVADAGAFALVFGLALALGVVSGFFPARQALRVDPVEVLREA